MENTSENIDIKALNDKIASESAFIDLLLLEMNKVIVGQKNMIERLLIGLLGNGHILLEGVPGLAKTLAINTLSQAVMEILVGYNSHQIYYLQMSLVHKSTTYKIINLPLKKDQFSPILS